MERRGETVKRMRTKFDIKIDKIMRDEIAKTKFNQKIDIKITIKKHRPNMILNKIPRDEIKKKKIVIKRIKTEFNIKTKSK